MPLVTTRTRIASDDGLAETLVVTLPPSIFPATHTTRRIGSFRPQNTAEETPTRRSRMPPSGRIRPASYRRQPDTWKRTLIADVSTFARRYSW